MGQQRHTKRIEFSKSEMGRLTFTFSFIKFASELKLSFRKNNSWKKEIKKFTTLLKMWLLFIVVCTIGECLFICLTMESL